MTLCAGGNPPKPSLCGLAARIIEDEDGHRQAQELRYAFFVQDKQWVPANPDTPGRERDDYDDFAWHVGVFKGDVLVGYLRGIRHGQPCGLMLTNSFGHLLTDQDLADVRSDPNAAEISRLVIRRDHCDQAKDIMLELIRVFYQRCLRDGVETLYFETEPTWLRWFRANYLRFVPFGQKHRFPDGTLTTAARGSIRQFEQDCPRDLLEYYRS